MTATTGFIFLYRLCKPFNLLRGGLLIFLISLFVYILLFHFDFFDLSQVNAGTMLLYIVFSICSVYIFDKLNMVVRLILNKFDRDKKISRFRNA